MKKETFRNMYNKCVPDKAVTRRLLQAIQDEDVANFAKKRKASEDDDTEDYLHIAATPGKKKLSPVFPAAAAVVCIIGAAVYTVNSRGDIAPGSGIYEGTDVISEIAAVEVSIGADPVYTVPATEERDGLANVTYGLLETAEGGTFPTGIADGEPKGPYTILDNGVQETILTEKPPSDDAFPAEIPAEDVPAEAFTTAEESKSTFGDFLNRCGRDDSGEGIKMTYHDSYVNSPDDHITVQYKDTDKIFSLLREYADTERAPMAVSSEPIPAVVLQIIYFDASQYPEINTDMDGVMTVGVRDDGIYVALTSADYFEFGCDSSTLFDELHKIVQDASGLPDYTLPAENEDISYSNLGELLDSIDGAVDYRARAVIYRVAEDYGNIFAAEMGCRRIMKLLEDMGNALPCEKKADTSQKVTVGLRKDITAEIYPDSVTFILPSGEYSFGTFERSDLWEPVNEVISRLDMDKYELSQMTEKEIKERLMGLDLADVDLALEHDEELSGRYGYFYYCGQWIVFAASDDLGGSSITEVTIQKMVGEAQAETELQSDKIDRETLAAMSESQIKTTLMGRDFDEVDSALDGADVEFNNYLPKGGYYCGDWLVDINGDSDGKIIKVYVNVREKDS